MLPEEALRKLPQHIDLEERLVPGATPGKHVLHERVQQLPRRLLLLVREHLDEVEHEPWELIAAEAPGRRPSGVL